MSGAPFAGKVVVVTGGARGIGDAIAVAFVEHGATVVALDRDAPSVPRVGVRHVAADVTDEASVAAAFADVRSAEGAPDVLVNNAGVQRVGKVGEISFADWNAVVSTHLTGMFLCSTQAIPAMVARGSGAIVSIASTAGLVGIPGRGPYCAAKAAMLGLTRAMALEVAPAGVRVNAVAPGYTRTAFIQQALDDGSQREDWLLERVPLGRLATPADIARVVRYLASDDAAYVTGQVVVADGGWTVQGVIHAPDWLLWPAPTADGAGGTSA
jgi:NAD(P)-dependent dehydrogenase (short-subunit alcohol dehydrogenase family)